MAKHPQNTVPEYPRRDVSAAEAEQAVEIAPGVHLLETRVTCGGVVVVTRIWGTEAALVAAGVAEADCFAVPPKRAHFFWSGGRGFHTYRHAQGLVSIADYGGFCLGNLPSGGDSAMKSAWRDCAWRPCENRSSRTPARKRRSS